MDLRFTPQDEAFRSEVREFLETALAGDYAQLRGRGGPGDEHHLIEARREWEAFLARERWSCVGWPVEHGGRAAPLMQQVIFNEEYARARAPGRVGHIGQELLGPTLIAMGTEAQKARFLEPIRTCGELWCQGYSEPNAGSDLANVQCRAERDGDEWVITGQKVWTSHAPWSDWCFALCRTENTQPKHRGISYILVPMNQPGIVIVPIKQITGSSEFAEVFFDGARTAIDNVVGPINGGWKVAMATLAFERGASTLGQQLMFRNELDAVVAAARQNGTYTDPVIRGRLARAEIDLRVMRLNALRTLSKLEKGELSREGMVTKLFWANWHRDLGELAMDVLGHDGDITPKGDGYPLSDLQRLFLWARCDTIYAGSNQIQRNIIGERALGLPKEPKVKA